MTDQRCLHPGDHRREPGFDTARLVYADWLEEPGISPAADYLRTELALASALDSPDATLHPTLASLGCRGPSLVDDLHSAAYAPETNPAPLSERLEKFWPGKLAPKAGNLWYLALRFRAHLSHSAMKSAANFITSSPARRTKAESDRVRLPQSNARNLSALLAPTPRKRCATRSVREVHEKPRFAQHLPLRHRLFFHLAGRIFTHPG